MGDKHLAARWHGGEGGAFLSSLTAFVTDPLAISALARSCRTTVSTVTGASVSCQTS